MRSGALSTGTLIDSVAYGNASTSPFLEGFTTAPTLSNGSSISRWDFDGEDVDDNSYDFTLSSSPTPRALNYP